MHGTILAHDQARSRAYRWGEDGLSGFFDECPTGSGNYMNLFEVSREIADRLTAMFTRDRDGRRAVFGGAEKFQGDPYWRDHLLFYEYFHSDNGAGLGASHQTGWTGLIGALLSFFGGMTPETWLERGIVRGAPSEKDSAAKPERPRRTVTVKT
jgi:hypothetical protein